MTPGDEGAHGRGVHRTLELAAQSDRGRVRPVNEDAHLAREELGLLAVADGMGGGPAGEVASRIAVQTLAEALGESSRADEGRRPTAAGIEGAIHRVQEVLLQEVRDRPDLRGMGTTLTAFQIDPSSGRWALGHIGDSRAYRFRRGALEPLTRDQTWVQEEIDRGRLDPDEARIHPARHILTMVLGMEGPLRVQTKEGMIENGDVFLVCSDGLSGVMEDHETEQLLRRRRGEPLSATVQELVETVNERGSPDNVTVGLLALREAPSSEG